MKTFTALACLAGLVCATLPAAQAAPVTYAFSVAGAAGSGSGSFQFDDASGTSGVLPGETDYALTSFSFDFGGVAYDLDDLDGQAGRAVFAGASFLGLDAALTAPPGGVSFAFLPSVGGEDPFLATVRATSSITFRLVPNGVPEPGTIGLGIAALGVLAAARRRRPG